MARHPRWFIGPVHQAREEDVLADGSQQTFLVAQGVLAHGHEGCQHLHAASGVVNLLSVFTITSVTSFFATITVTPALVVTPVTPSLLITTTPMPIRIIAITPATPSLEIKPLREIMKENTEYLESFIIIVDDTKFQQGQKNLVFSKVSIFFIKIFTCEKSSSSSLELQTLGSSSES